MTLENWRARCILKFCIHYYDKLSFNGVSYVKVLLNILHLMSLRILHFYVFCLTLNFIAALLLCDIGCPFFIVLLFIDNIWYKQCSIKFLVNWLVALIYSKLSVHVCKFVIKINFMWNCHTDITHWYSISHPVFYSVHAFLLKRLSVSSSIIPNGHL